jgi:hypothetical protein
VNLYSFEFQGVTIEFTYRNGYVAYTFKLGESTYGSKMKPQSHKVMDLIACSVLLITSAFDTIKALQKDENS